MDTPNWIAALGLYVTYPVLMVATFLIAIAAFASARWLRSYIGTERICCT